MITRLRNRGLQYMMLLAAAIGAGYVLAHARADSPGEAAVGDKAPLFELGQMGGHDIRLADYEGKGVVLHFWASWCNPCINELPLLNEAYKLAGINMVAINVGENEATARKFAERYELAFPIALDREFETKTPYRVAGLPLTVVVDESGNIIERHEGEMTDMSEMMRLMGMIK